MSEAVKGLLEKVGINPDHKSVALEKLGVVDSRFVRDLKLNVGSVLGSKNLTSKEAHLLALSVAANEKCEVLQVAFEEMARKEEASDEEIAETYACTSLLNVNNVFYRFRHYMSDVNYYNNTPAGIRMSTMMNPVLGKEFFELMSLAVSALNGCQRCVTSHEHSVKEHGAPEARVYDAIRLASVIKSLAVVL